MKHVIITGPPGSGKGTLASRISLKFNIRHLSTGEVLRNTTDKDVQYTLKKGLFVDDSLINKVVLDQLNKNERLLLDGYPRNINQARVLGDRVQIVIVLQVDDKECIRRIQGRHGHRTDDTNTSVIQGRLRIYHIMTGPMVEYYTKKGLVHFVNGNKSPDEIYTEVEKILQ